MSEKNNISAPEEEIDVNEFRQIRIDKLKAMQEAGNDPFEITTANQTHESIEIKENYDELEGKTVSVCGRMIARRIMGKASFATIQDKLGRIQSYISINDIGEESYTAFKKAWDIGDIIEIKGFVFKTRTEEISIHAQEIRLLTKSLLPLPEKFHGLTNTDTRYRQRYLDLIVNPEVKDTFIKRSKVISSIRRYLDEQGFMEVETPIQLSRQKEQAHIAP